MQRRKFLKYAGTIFGIGALTGLYSWQIEPFWLEFVELKMPLKNLPAELQGKKVMQISDIHVSNRFDYRYLIESFEKAELHKPEIVVYTGDFLTNGYTSQKEKIKEVIGHAVKGSLGTFAIFGNHDYGKNWAENEVADGLQLILEEQGITVLRNQKVEINGIQIIGFEDLWGPNFDGALALHSYEKDKPAIALCHNPDACDLDFWGDFEGWILSGHTHGGQVKAPFLDPWVLPVENSRYTSGQILLDTKRTLYINRALGHLHQIRFNVRPEITVFTLTVS